MKKYFFLFLVLVFFSVFALKAQAAEIFFGTQSKNISVNTTFQVGVFVDTQSQSLNAVEGQIAFPKDMFEFKGFYSGNSTLTFWVKQPTLVSDGLVFFSGVTPGGFSGSGEYLFSLILKAKQKGSATISAANENILINDGNGSEASITKAPLNITIVDEKSPQIFTPLHDIVPPEIFEPKIGQDPNIFNGKYFVAFGAQDKGSGIDHYQVMETGNIGSFKSFFESSQWVVAQSPYVLQDQSLQSIIYVKAVDRSGNVKIVKVAPKNALPWYQNYFVWSIITILSVVFVWYTIWKRNRL